MTVEEILRVGELTMGGALRCWGPRAGACHECSETEVMQITWRCRCFLGEHEAYVCTGCLSPVEWGTSHTVAPEIQGRIRDLAEYTAVNLYPREQVA